MTLREHAAAATFNQALSETQLDGSSWHIASRGSLGTTGLA
jgi:hypothetical protein